jgi:hypothetical protein
VGTGVVTVVVLSVLEGGNGGESESERLYVGGTAEALR